MRDGLDRAVPPRSDEIRAVAREFGLPELAVDDAISAHQRPKWNATTTPNSSSRARPASAWAAILFAPTLVGTVYGMNFDHIPELHWLLGYPLALGPMLVTSLTRYVILKHRHWL